MRLSSHAAVLIVLSLVIVVLGTAPASARPMAQMCDPVAGGGSSTYYYYDVCPPPSSTISDATLDWYCLDVYPPTATAVGQTILFIHGGGFTCGDKAGSSAVEFCDAMAALGYHVVSANYSLAERIINGRLDPDEASFPRAIHDLKAAISWIRSSSAAQSEGLPNCIIAVGNSAGGALATLLGTTNDVVVELEPDPGDTFGTDYHVDGVVTFAAGTDFVSGGCDGYVVLDGGNPVACVGSCEAGTWSPSECCHQPCNRVPCNDSSEVGWCADYPGRASVEFFTGVEWGRTEEGICLGTTQVTHNVWSTDSPFVNASAVHWVDDEDVPYFGFSAELDSLVPGRQTGILVRDLIAQGVTAGKALKTFSEGCGHGLETLFKTPPSCSSPWIGTTCATWDPFDLMCAGCSSAEGAALHTQEAIDNYLGITCN